METAPKTDSPVESATAPRVEFTGSVLQQIRQHARSSMRAEICGILIGSAADGVTRVTARIVGEGASQGGAHVTFTQDTWEHIYKVKDAEFPSESIVGWYHSHPGFGIFLSDYDLFIHENFFNALHQVAWVFDPHSDEEGCFGWIAKKVEPLPEVAVIRKHRPPVPEQAQKEAESRKLAPPRAASVVKKVEKSSNSARQLGRIGIIVFVAVLAFVAGFALRPYFARLKRAASTMFGGPTQPNSPPSPAAPAAPLRRKSDGSTPSSINKDIIVGNPSGQPAPADALAAPPSQPLRNASPTVPGNTATPATASPSPPASSEVPAKENPPEKSPAPHQEQPTDPQPQGPAEPVEPPKPPPQP
jgi:proteasome lid subunit RPN8/RPN11